MLPTLICDTDVLIDLSRGSREAIASMAIAHREHVIGLSTVSQLEMMVGARDKRELRIVESFLDGFVIVRITPEVCDRSVRLVREYRLSHGLLLADALIAATAMFCSCHLMTKNVRDFRFINGLKLAQFPCAPD